MLYSTTKEKRRNFPERAARILLVCTVLISSFSLPSCKPKDSSEKTVSSTEDTRQTESVPQVGNVPGEYQKIIEEDRFRQVEAYSDKLFSFEASESDEGQRNHTITMMDLYGEPVVSYSIELDNAYGISGFAPTSDGGFIFAAGYSPNYIPGRDQAEKGFHTRVIRCDEKGQVVFEIVLDQESIRSFEHCIEKDGKFYFFGEYQNEEYPDVSVRVIDGKGNPVSIKIIGGSSHDKLRHVEETEDGFVLWVDSMSEDGDFSGSGANYHELYWEITLDAELNITGKEQLSERPPLLVRVGEKDGKPIYSNDPMFEGFDAGWINCYIDYGDTYLLVSNHNTGEYPYTPPLISSIWYYTETVYSMYDDKSGTLLFRASVDSSPDYDAMRKNTQSV